MERLFENSPKHWCLKKITEGAGAGYHFNIYGIKLENVKIIDILLDEFNCQEAIFEADIVPDKYHWSYEDYDNSINSKNGYFTYCSNCKEGDEVEQELYPIKISGKVSGSCMNIDQEWYDNSKEWDNEDFIKEITRETYDIGQLFGAGWIHVDLPKVVRYEDANWDDIDISDQRNGYKVSYIHSADINIPEKEVNSDIHLCKYGEKSEDNNEEDMNESKMRESEDIVNKVADKLELSSEEKENLFSDINKGTIDYFNTNVLKWLKRVNIECDSKTAKAFRSYIKDILKYYVFDELDACKFHYEPSEISLRNKFGFDNDEIDFWIKKWEDSKEEREDYDDEDPLKIDRDVCDWHNNYYGNEEELPESRRLNKSKMRESFHNLSIEELKRVEKDQDPELFNILNTKVVDLPKNFRFSFSGKDWQKALTSDITYMDFLKDLATRYPDFKVLVSEKDNKIIGWMAYSTLPGSVHSIKFGSLTEDPKNNVELLFDCKKQLAKFLEDYMTVYWFACPENDKVFNYYQKIVDEYNKKGYQAGLQDVNGSKLFYISRMDRQLESYINHKKINEFKMRESEDELDNYSDLLDKFIYKSKDNYKKVCKYVDEIGFKDTNFGDLDIDTLKQVCKHFKLNEYRTKKDEPNYLNSKNSLATVLSNNMNKLGSCKTKEDLIKFVKSVTKDSVGHGTSEDKVEQLIDRIKTAKNFNMALLAISNCMLKGSGMGVIK